MSTAVGTPRVTPCDAVLGATVEGIDLGDELGDDVIAHIRRALLEHEVLFFPGQGITPEQQVAFGRRFGTLHTHAVLGALAELPEVVVFDTDEDAPVAEMWHSDVSCAEQPPLGSILQLQIVPPQGGATHWASMTAAYDALDDATKARIADLRGIHRSWWKPVESAEHPIVRTHPETGRRSIYANGLFTKSIVGMDDDGGGALITELATHATNAEFEVAHEWRAGDIAFWDNRVTQHRVDNDFGEHRRRGLRVTINGDTPR